MDDQKCTYALSQHKAATNIGNKSLICVSVQENNQVVDKNAFNLLNFKKQISSNIEAFIPTAQ